MKSLISLMCLITLMCNYSYAQNGWYSQNSGTNKFLTDIYFTDQNTGWATGWTGTILATNDGGENWIPQSPPPNNAYEGVFFTDDQTGWAIGYGGMIIHTADGGVTWEDQTSGTDFYILDIQFIDSNIGWTAGGRFEDFTTDPAREILYTNDSGETWITQLIEYNEPPLKSIDFITSNIGYAVGESGTILKTSDGGLNWIELMYNQQYHFSAVDFINTDTGWVVGQDLSVDHFAVIFKTTDGGTTWSSQTFGSDESLQGVCFANTNKGWAVGGMNTTGIILYTSDGGEIWDYQDPVSAKSLTSVCFINDEFGWAAGYDGTIIHTDDGGIVGIEEQISLDKNILTANVYPNPFKNNTTINYNLKHAASVQISISNNLGELVQVIKQNQSSGKQQVVWNAEGLSAGMYYFHIKADYQIANGKIILMN